MVAAFCEEYSNIDAMINACKQNDVNLLVLHNRLPNVIMQPLLSEQTKADFGCINDMAAISMR